MEWLQSSQISIVEWRKLANLPWKGKKLFQLVGKANSNLAYVILKLGLFERFRSATLEVITGVFQRLCGEIELGDLSLVYKCLIEKISSCIKDGCLVHLNHLLSLLTSTVAHFNRRKVYGLLLLDGLHQMMFSSYPGFMLQWVCISGRMCLPDPAIWWHQFK